MSFWSSENTARLTELWDTVLSASQIANILGATSKNAIISKAHRLGLPARKVPVATAMKERAKRVRVYVPKARKLPPQPKPSPFQPVVSTAALPPRNLTLMERADGCCFPMGRDSIRGWLYCGNPRRAAKNYCPAHYRLMYQPKPEKPKRNPHSVGRFEMAEVFR